jgi:TatD DNase family protein
LIDTHAHLDALEEPPVHVLERARSAGVRRVVSIGTGVASCRRTLDICEASDGVFASLGIHPHQAADARPEDLEELRGLLLHPKAVAVGETGLDYYRDRAPRERQADLFRAHGALAAELRLPLVVHTRLAEEDTAAILGELAASIAVVLHCFSSSVLLDPALERSWYVSFAGNVTYPKAAELRWAAAQIPRDRLLAETDSPYLAPQPVRGRKNEPAFVTHTLAALADARGDGVVQLERALDENASRVFGLP